MTLTFSVNPTSPAVLEAMELDRRRAIDAAWAKRGFIKIRERVAYMSTSTLEKSFERCERILIAEKLSSGVSLSERTMIRAGQWARAISDELAWRKLEWIGP